MQISFATHTTEPFPSAISGRYTPPSLPSSLHVQDNLFPMQNHPEYEFDNDDYVRPTMDRVCKEKQILIEIKLLATCTDGFFTETLQSIHDRRTQLENLRLIYLHFSINSCFLVVGSRFLHRIRNQSKFQKSASS